MSIPQIPSEVPVPGPSNLPPPVKMEPYAGIFSQSPALLADTLSTTVGMRPEVKREFLLRMAEAGISETFKVMDQRNLNTACKLCFPNCQTYSQLKGMGEEERHLMLLNELKKDYRNFTRSEQGKFEALYIQSTGQFPWQEESGGGTAGSAASSSSARSQQAQRASLGARIGARIALPIVAAAVRNFGLSATIGPDGKINIEKN